MQYNSRKFSILKSQFLFQNVVVLIVLLNSRKLVFVLFAPMLRNVILYFLKDAIIVEMRFTKIVMRQVSIRDYRMISRFVGIYFFVNIHPCIICVISYRTKIATDLNRSVTTSLLIMNKKKYIWFQHKKIIQKQDDGNIAIMKKFRIYYSNYHHYNQSTVFIELSNFLIQV